MRLEGKCDPPDVQEGSPTDAVAKYHSFDPNVTAAEMDAHFDLNVSGCVPVGPPPLGGGAPPVGVDARHHAALLRLGAMATLF